MDINNLLFTFDPNIYSFYKFAPKKGKTIKTKFSPTKPN